VTSKLHLPEGSQMIMVRRQISVDHRCLIVDENYFNLNLTTFITEDNLSNNTVFELLEKNGIHIRKGSQIFSSSLLNGLNAELLNLSEGSPALVIKTLLFNARELPLQYSISYCNPDTYEHEILLSR
jgi:DNA-binding GntR family transcriptional regulator